MTRQKNYHQQSLEDKLANKFKIVFRILCYTFLNSHSFTPFKERFYEGVICILYIYLLYLVPINIKLNDIIFNQKPEFELLLILNVLTKKKNLNK